MKRRILGVASAFALALAGGAESASAFSYNYCVGVSLGVNAWCSDNQYLNRTWNQGWRSGSGYICVRAVTAAGNVRGGGATPCDASGYARLCLASATPSSRAEVMLWWWPGVVDHGHTDDSPNHSQPCY